MNRARKTKAKALTLRSAMRRAEKCALEGDGERALEERVSDLIESARDALESGVVFRDGVAMRAEVALHGATLAECAPDAMEGLEDAADYLDEAEAELRSVRKALRAAADALRAAVRAERRKGRG